MSSVCGVTHFIVLFKMMHTHTYADKDNRRRKKMYRKSIHNTIQPNPKHIGISYSLPCGNKSSRLQESTYTHIQCSRFLVTVSSLLCLIRCQDPSVLKCLRFMLSTACSPITDQFYAKNKLIYFSEFESTDSNGNFKRTMLRQFKRHPQDYHQDKP